MIIIGKNAILEAMKQEKEIEKILLSKEHHHASLSELLKVASEKRIVRQYVPDAKLKELARTEKHQGIIAFVSEYQYFDLEEVVSSVRAKGEKLMLYILDNLTDPHNFGAIIRSAELNGVHGIIIPKRNSVTVNETVSKVSAGAISHVKVIKVSNINATIESLKQKNVWIYGLVMEGTPIYDTDLLGDVAIVVGSEGEGIRKSVMENCDFKITIPMYGKLNSLNASVAAGISMYEMNRQRYMFKKV